MQEKPQGRQRILKLDGSIVDELGNVIQPAEAAPTAPGLQSFMPRNPSDAPDLGSIDPKEFISGLIKAGTAATGFLPGVKMPMVALRTALGASGDALAATVEGEDPLDAAMRGGAMNMAGEGLARVLPRRFQR
jgi:hypothetical protein